MQEFFESVLEPIFNLENIKSIVEIGADNGNSAEKLIKYTDKVNGKIIKIESDTIFDSVKEIKDADCVILNAGNNSYSELKTINDIYEGDRFPLILFCGKSDFTDVKDFIRDYPILELEIKSHNKFSGFKMIISNKRHFRAFKWFSTVNEDIEEKYKKQLLEINKKANILLAKQTKMYEEAIIKDHKLAEKLICAEGGIGWKYAFKTALTKGIFAAATNIKAIKEIRRNGGFDVLYYCAKNTDVIQKSIDPLLHFMWFGGYEGRNPSVEFDVRRYQNFYDDVKSSGVNPYAHYLLFGKNEGRNNFASYEKKSLSINGNDLQLTNISELVQSNNESSVKIKDLQEDFSFRDYNYNKFAEKLESLKNKIITIIVPVYNAYEETCECIKSVIENTDFPYKLMLINDCSPDSRISELLNKYADHENIIVVNNEKNLGFVGTTNYGITHSENDVVFLNSDTRVSKGWLRKLAIAAYHKDNIATVTPFSNAAGAFCVPVMGENGNIPEGFDLDTITSLIEKKSQLDYVEVPTGNGFCMYVTRKALDDVGILDIETFSKGYGEENDFCMRAKANGYINIIADDVYIYHKRSASFKEEKQQLITKNRKILDERYPSYAQEIRVFSESPKLIENRQKIKGSVENDFPADYSKKRMLYVLHEGTGGTVKTNEDLMNFIERNNTEVYMLTSNTKQMKLYSFEKGDLQLLKTWELKKSWNIADFYVPEYADIYFDVIANLHIDLIHIRHLFKHSFDIVHIADTLNIPVILSFHDFYFICPTINLVNSDVKYCGGECRKCDTNCPMPSSLISIDGQINNWTQNIWQKEVSVLLEKVKAFVTTSDYTKETYLKIYPSIKNKFFVIEHGRNFEYDRAYRGQAPADHKDKKIVILLAGNLSVNKGSEYITQLIKADKEHILEFHSIGACGNVNATFDKAVIKHGKYVREEFDKLIAQIKPAYVGVFSIWPETYCHIVTEAWSCGIPCIVSDIGTLKERALKNGGCVRADLSDPKKAYRNILDISFSDEYNQLCEQVQNADIHSIERMGTEYAALYHKVLYGSSDVLVWLNNFDDKKVASSHIRVVSPIINNPVVKKKMAAVEAHNAYDVPFDSNVIENINIFVQRDKIDIEAVTDLSLRFSGKENVKLIYELDDNLFCINKKHPEYAVYKDTGKLVKNMIDISSEFVVTNKVIAETLPQNVKIIPNYIDCGIWRITPCAETTKERSEYKILYFGTLSHKSDLKILKEPMKKLNAKLNNIGKKAALIVVGCSQYSEDWFNVLDVPSDSKEYPHFARWLQSVDCFDIGVAPLDLKNSLNYSKSPLKYLEYTALGIPCICTDIEPYQEIDKNGQNVILIKENSADEWASAMFRLLTDISLRKKLIENAQSDVRENYILADHYQQISDIIFE